MIKEHIKFQNREISWLSFNERVLEEAESNTNPLLEKLKFLGIFSSNLDEFFMIRVAGLRDQIEAGYNEPAISGHTPQEQIDMIYSIVHELSKRQYSEWDKIKAKISSLGVEFPSIKQAQTLLGEQLKKLFEKEIFPVITPMAIDPTHPFPFIHSNTLNILCTVAGSESELKYAIIPVPGILPRYYIMTVNKKKYIILIEDIINEYIDNFFPGYVIFSSNFFRITRNADLTVNEEGSYDLLKEVEGSLKRRKQGAAIRMEINSHFEEYCLEVFNDEFEITPDMIYKQDGPLDLTFAFSLYGELVKIIKGEVYPAFTPYYEPVEDIFSELRKNDILLHHPYESFQTVVDFLKQSACDPNVLAIKQTLYRNSGAHSLVVKELLKAVENGKQVTVLVELKARFDEEKNIQWAKKLEDAGAHVIYGVKGLKTHAKILLVVRREENRLIRRYMHFSTGNYNEKTASLYTDISLLTADTDMAYDASAFFNFLTGFSVEPEWRKISISPDGIREKLVQLIDNEIKKHNPKSPGRIICKMNAIVHPQVIEKLYEASNAGVQIDLIVRGICCLKAGVKGFSENIRVKSVVGRFLEHSRIFYFKNAGDEQVYISSADWMVRNLDRRIEIMIPIEKAALKEKLIHILDCTLRDNEKSRELIGSTYKRCNPVKKDEKLFNCQEYFVSEVKGKTPAELDIKKATLTPLTSDF